jgi:hypothetical protein
MSEPTERILAVLNEMAAADPEATRALAFTRVPCNRALADHPTIEVLADDDMASFEVGLLGVVNGLARALDPGLKDMAVAAVFNDGKLVRFDVVNPRLRSE